MPSRETYKIGQIEIPKVAFPKNFQDVLSGYMAAYDVSHDYIAMHGVERPNLLVESNIDVNLLRLYAAVNCFKEAPENGLAVLDIANAFACLEDADGAKLVLESLEASAGLHLYPVWHEDPMFHLGWYMADLKRYEEAIDAYQKSLSKHYEDGKWAVESHLGSVYHELGQFEKAQKHYQTALGLLSAEPKTGNVDLSPYTDSIKDFLDQAIADEVFRGERMQFGLQIRSH